MQEPAEGSIYYFVDESGDPIFYNKNGVLIVGSEGCSSILIMGFIETTDPNSLRRILTDLRKELVGDPYLSGIPSMEKTKSIFHAKDDCPEVRQAVYRKLKGLDFRAQFIVARKIEIVFRKTFNSESAKFYDHLIVKLFENVLHRYENNRIYFAKRGSKTRQKPLEEAINNAIANFKNKWGADFSSKVQTDVAAQTLKGEPCLQIIDYMNWAVYRAFIKREMRFYKMVEEKVSLLVDLYDRDNYPNNWYSRKNPFDCMKISPIQARPL